MKDHDLKGRIASLETQLAGAEAAARDLPVQAAEAAVYGDDKKSETLFSEGEAATRQVNRLRATLEVLRSQIAEEEAAQKKSDARAKLDTLNAEADATKKKLAAAISKLSAAWDEVAAIEPGSAHLKRLSGKMILEDLFNVTLVSRNYRHLRGMKIDQGLVDDVLYTAGWSIRDNLRRCGLYEDAGVLFNG